MSILLLPNELLLDIAGLFGHQRDVYAMARSCRGLYFLLRKYLLQHNIRYAKGSALIWAAKNDRRNLVRRLLRLGAEVNTRGKPLRPGTPLHHAAAAGHFCMVQLLLRKGGDPKACGVKGFMPLLVALLKRHEEVAMFLFSKMGKPNAQIAGEAGYTPLHAACYRRLLKSARMFLESGADVHVRTSTGNTPLHLALRRETSNKPNDTSETCMLELVMLLLEFGARIDAKACSLGKWHHDPQVRGIFHENKNPTPLKASFINVGRRWLAEGGSNADCLFYLTPANVRQSQDHQSADVSGEDCLTNVAENLLNDEIFPALHPSRPLLAPQISTNAWDPAKAKKIRETMRMDENTAGEASSTGLTIDPFPKLIGHKSPHPLQSAAQLWWRDMRNPKTHFVIEEICTASVGKIQESRLQSGDGPKRKRWRPLQLH